MTGEWRQSKGVSTILCYSYCTAVLQGPPRQSGVLKTSLLLKVSKFQNEFMKSSFLPKYERNIVRISTLCSVPYYRAEILTIFCWYFGRNDDFINSFWDLLTFGKIYLNIYPNYDRNLIRRLNIFHWNLVKKYGILFNQVSKSTALPEFVRLKFVKKQSN